MLERIALLDAGVIRALLVALVGLLGLILSFFGVDEAAFGEKAGRVVDALLLLLTTGAAVYAMYSRATKPTPPLTQAAVDATRMAVADGKLTLTPGSKQGGRATISLLGFLSALGVVALLAGAAGCAGTASAYKAASSLDDYAYVVAEHYRALVREAANLKQSGRVPQAMVERMQAADKVLKPIVVGDPNGSPPRAGLRELALAFKTARNAQTEAELQKAVDDAVLALTDFIKAVETARGAQ